MKTSEMNLRQYLSTMSFQPKRAEALEKLFGLAEKWRQHTAHTHASENADLCRGFNKGESYCAGELDSILGAAE